jgi:hypothetical protein
MAAAFAICEHRLNTVSVLQERRQRSAVGINGAVLCTEFPASVKTDHKTKEAAPSFGAAASGKSLRRICAILGDGPLLRRLSGHQNDGAKKLICVDLSIGSLRRGRLAEKFHFLFFGN